MFGLRITKNVATGICIGVWTLGIWWALVSSLPHNPQSPGLRAERGTRLVLPEGWGFFTRDPREADLILARLDENDEWRLEPPHASLDNLLGLRRLSRALPVESSQILHQVEPAFISCGDDNWRHCTAKAPVHEIQNPVPDAKLCGDVTFVRREPVPWAWADLLHPDDMPTNIFRTRIRCDHGTKS